MLITLHIPFGNQTWQREISHLEMMFPFQCPFKSGISQPAIFDCQRVSTNIPFTLLIFHENFNTSPFYYDFTEKRIYSHLQKYIQEKNHSNSGKWCFTILFGDCWDYFTYIYIYILYIYIIYIIFIYTWSLNPPVLPGHPGPARRRVVGPLLGAQSVPVAWRVEEGLAFVWWV